MTLNNLVQIDSRFEKSVNLTLDLHDPSKLAGYIPTSSSLKLIEMIFKETLSMSEKRASLLVGPYGKGKSHLLLVVLSYLAKYNTEQLAELRKRIRPEFVNSFEGVSGRLTEIFFTVSSKNNYELIADAIKKKEPFTAFASENTLFKKVANESYLINIFSSLFTDEDFRTIVAEGCYPLTPVASMILLELCEKIAQNERTIFTYLTSKDRNALAQVIKRTNADSFVGVDSIYDYFADIFRGDRK